MTETAALPPVADAISADEIRLYDRQIRLWGKPAQERLRQSDVLLVGMRALANEVAKNLVLGGVRSLTVLDDAAVCEEDLGAQFLVSLADVGKNRAEACIPAMQKLNPRVKITAETLDVRTDTLPAAYLERFHLVIATDLDFATLVALNTACRLATKPLYAAGTHGLYGYIFADLVEHTYAVKSPPSNVAPVTGRTAANHLVLSVQLDANRSKKDSLQTVTHSHTYTPLTSALSAPLPPFVLKSRRRLADISPVLPALIALWHFEHGHGGRRPRSNSTADVSAYTALAMASVRRLGLDQSLMRAGFLRRFLQGLGTEMAAVTSVVGGHLAQDALNALQRQEAPIDNLCVFDGDAFAAPIYALYLELEIAWVDGPQSLPTEGIIEL